MKIFWLLQVSLLVALSVVHPFWRFNWLRDVPDILMSVVLFGALLGFPVPRTTTPEARRQVKSSFVHQRWLHPFIEACDNYLSV
ncbi:hypothetical protein AKJ16_DCAP18818 [Drosera capensis]